MPTIRTFIAIEIDSNTRNSISKIQNIFRRSQTDIKLVNPENIHITLLFMGNIDSNEIKKITQLLKKSILGIKPFKIYFSDINCFPNNKNPKIVWLGIETGNKNLLDLNKRICYKLKNFYVKDRREYQPHITIARIKTNKSTKNIKKTLSTIPKQICNPMEINNISFIKSTLSSKGPRYETIVKLQLFSNDKDNLV